jgi:hypothetical protein
MYELKKEIGNIFTSKFVGTGPSPYKKIIYRAAVSQRLKNTAIHHTAVNTFPGFFRMYEVSIKYAKH